jgi:uncharacterized protein (TIGR03437 family)
MRRVLLGLLLCEVLRAQAYTVEPFAGSDWVGDGGPARQALLFQAEGLAADGSGNLYIADAADHRVRRVSPAGIIETVAGTGRPGSGGDGGPAAAAQLRTPYGLAFDSAGNLYIADLGNARVRRVDRDGVITTVAGGGVFREPRNLAFDSAGNLYISDFGAHRVFRWSPAGVLDVVAGTGVAGFSAGAGNALAAMLAHPAGLAVDRSGALYIADSQNGAVRKVSGGRIETAAQAGLPTGLAFDAFGTLHIADAAGGQILRAGQTALAIPARDVVFGPEGRLYASGGSVVRRRTAQAVVAVIAGGGDSAYGDFGPAREARLNRPVAVAADGEGNVYIADRDNHRVRHVDRGGTITTAAGTGLAGDSGDFGPATRAALNTPVALALDAAGNLYIADQGNHRVRMVTPGGAILPVARVILPSGLAVDRAGRLYIADQSAGRIYRADPGGVLTSLASGLASPAGLAADDEGNVYFAEPPARRVRKLTPAGSVVDLAPGAWSEPRGVSLTGSGVILVADTGLLQILRAGESGAASAVDVGGAIAAPWGIAAGPGGVLFLAHADDNRVSVLRPRPSVAPLRTLEVLNAASRAPGPVAPGMLVLLRGADFAAAEVSAAGFPARVLAAGAGELVVQIPEQVAGLSSATIQVIAGGAVRASTAAAVAAASPALFADQYGAALALLEDGSVHSAANPAPRGSVLVLYGTGQGLGGASSVRIAGYEAELLYAGPAAAYPGLFQLNVRVPAGYIPPGAHRAVWSVGEFASPGADVYVRD